MVVPGAIGTISLWFSEGFLQFSGLVPLFHYSRPFKTIYIENGESGQKVLNPLELWNYGTTIKILLNYSIIYRTLQKLTEKLR